MRKRDITQHQKPRVPLPEGILESDLREIKHFFHTDENWNEYSQKISEAKTEKERKAIYAARDKRQKEYDSQPENQRVDEFDMWYTESFGWCIPTLLIRRASVNRRFSRPDASSDRTYAISLNGQTCRIGMGPHVLRQIHVYVSKARQPDLQKFLDLRDKGEVMANTTRDRISSRRAQGSLRRSSLPGWL